MKILKLKLFKKNLRKLNRKCKLFLKEFFLLETSKIQLGFQEIDMLKKLAKRKMTKVNVEELPRWRKRRTEFNHSFLRE